MSNIPDKKVRNVGALNQDFARFDQVEKRQRYRLAEANGTEEFDEDFRFRTCDLGRWLHGNDEDRRTFAHELGEALREIGFAILDGHDISPSVFDQAESAALDLFSTTSIEDKLRFRAKRQGSVNQGYFPKKETSNIHPDLVEAWVFCRRAFDPLRSPEFWPRPEFAAPFEALCLANQALVLPIMQSLLTYLSHDVHLYDTRLAGSNFILRLNYYPPIDSEDDLSGAGRLLGHEDTSLFTLLPAPRIEGLQVLNRRNMKWVRLNAPPGSLILNTGDYMQRISNDILPSTTHRVSKPRDPLFLRQPRASFPMNVILWENEMLEVLPGLPSPKYPPVRAETFHTRVTSKYYGEGYAVE